MDAETQPSSAEVRPRADNGSMVASDPRDITRDYRDRLLVGLMRLLRRGVRSLSLEASLKLADRTAILLPRVLARENRVSLEQIAAVMPELDEAMRHRIIKTMFRGISRSVVEVARLREIALRFDSYVTVEGLEAMDEALALGRGVIVVTGHIGNWELSAASFGIRGYPVTVVAAPVKGARLKAESIANRTAVNVETIERDSPRASRAILRTLRRKRILALVVDQATRGRTVTVPFFGRQAVTPAGPAVLALRTRAPLLVTFIHRKDEGGHHLTVVRPALPPPPSGSPSGEESGRRWVEQTMTTLNAMIEMEVRRRPQDWVWWHRRWAPKRAAPPNLDEKV